MLPPVTAIHTNSALAAPALLKLTTIDTPESGEVVTPHHSSMCVTLLVQVARAEG